MEAIGEKKRVCVTGAGGFIASWLVKLLLSKGYIVHGNVRQPSDEKNAHLKELENASENLILFKADLLDYDSVVSAISSCEGVFHLASPVPSTKVSNPEVALLSPAVTGTLNVLKACSEAKVKRVVIASSVVAVTMNPNWPKGKIMDEECWSDSEYCRTTENWYCVSKTLAESEALEYAEKHGLDLVTVLPCMAIGPMLQSTMNASSLFLINLSKGSGSSSSSALHHLNSPFGDTTFTKVFVGGLAWETQSESLRRHFEQFGEILEAVVIADKSTGRSKGYGFVTFRDPEGARRACVDPSPFIDGRRANCNLASAGRPRPALPLANLRPAVPSFGSVGVPRGAYVGSSAYQQASPYNYQQSFSYPQHGYTAYGPEYTYQENVYNPYTGQQYIQVYGVPGTLNTAVFPYGQFGHPLPGGQGYTPAPGHALPGHYLLQLSGPNGNVVTTAAIPAIQPAYPAEMAARLPGQPQPQLYIPSNLPFTQGIGSE